MEPKQIQDADILDIIFEGRNKDYGAYELRKTYNRRIVKSLIVTGSLIGLLFIGGWVAGRNQAKIHVPPMDSDPTIVIIEPPVTPLPPVVPPPVRVLPQQVAMRAFTTPLLVETDPPKNERPPENADLDSLRIGTVNAAGAVDVGDAPPIADKGGMGLLTTPKRPNEDDGRTWIKVETDAAFPGGPAAWLRFLNQNLRVPDEAMSIGISGQVVVQFIVDKDGNVSDVEAVSGPEQGGLREEAVRVIRKSGKWTPALQNGRYGKAYRKQPVTFVIGE